MQTLNAVAAILSGLGTLAGVFGLYYNLRRRFEALESQGTARRQENRQILQALFACLDGLMQQGCNGEVARCYGELRDYIISNRE